MLELGLSSLQFSILSSTIFVLVYGVMQIPAGLIIQRFGLKKTLGFACTLCTLSCFSFTFVHDYYFALFCRVLMALGASFGFIGLLVAIREWLSLRYTTFFIGLSQFIGTLGPIAAAAPLQFLMLETGLSWRALFGILGILGVLLTLPMLLIVDNKVSGTRARTFGALSPQGESLLWGVLKQGQPWFIAFVSAALYFSLEYLSENEGRAYLGLKGLSPIAATSMLSLSWIGYAIGCPLLGLLSDIFKRRYPFIILCLGLILISMIIMLGATSHIYLAMAFFGLGFGASAQNITFVMMAENISQDSVAIGFGLNNCFITVISIINAPLIGWLLDLRNMKTPLAADDYTDVFSIMLVVILLALGVSSLFLKESFGNFPNKAKC